MTAPPAKERLGAEADIGLVVDDEDELASQRAT
jgi:hypothetical protein